MRVLFIGGTGIISTACTELALRRGHQLTLLNRGRRSAAVAAGAESLLADITDESATASALGGRHFDVVVNFLAFSAPDVARDIRLFRGKVGQYFYISSASAYQRPVRNYKITESTPLDNPLWDYSRAKIAGEETLLSALRTEAFPGVIIRPSLTYSDFQVTLPVNSWQKSFTAVDRLRRGQPVIIPGDGTSLWTLTHNSDFAKGLVGLFGNPAAVGNAFHITSDEVQSWNQYYAEVARAAGVANPRFVHIASDFIISCLPDMQGTLLGDKAASVVLDNTKIKSFVPDFSATVPYREGIARTLAWFDADPSRQVIDHEANAKWDRLIGAYESGLAAAVKLFNP